ncbi:MAG: hypothetical protein GY906_38850, partial [bacterium]|nr:hypothetical protein [bacterium]
LSAHDRRSLKTGDRITIDVYEFVFQIGEDGAFEPDIIIDSEVMTAPRVDLPAPEAQQLEADSEPEDSFDAGSEGEAESENGSEAPTTRLKPVTCPGHPEERATELCTVCKQAFCAQCVIEQDEATVCRSCADVPHSI